jgi:hypothetical protein
MQAWWPGLVARLGDQAWWTGLVKIVANAGQYPVRVLIFPDFVFPITCCFCVMF